MDNQNNKNNKNNKQGISFIFTGHSYYIDPGDRTVPVSGNDLCKRDYL